MHQVRQAAGYWVGPNLFPLHVEADEATALTKCPCNKLSYELRHRETGDSQLASRSGGLATEKWTSRANGNVVDTIIPCASFGMFVCRVFTIFTKFQVYSLDVKRNKR